MPKVPKAGKGVTGRVPEVPAKAVKAPKPPKPKKPPKPVVARAPAEVAPPAPTPAAPAPAPVALPEGAQGAAGGGPVRRLIDAATGAKLCYGEPVRAGERLVVPVARVSAVGGWGFGRGGGTDGGDGLGHGGGGTLEARPTGFIEVGPDGARYEAFPDPDQLGRTLRAAATALVTVTGAAAALRRHRGPAGLLPLGRR